MDNTDNNTDKKQKTDINKNKDSEYYINLNRLCQEKFGKSAYKVVCEDMAKTPATLTRLYSGNFPHQRAVRQDFADHFKMLYGAFIGYLKYGPRGEECRYGYSAKILKEKLEVEEPNYDALFEFLDITKEEWEKAINGEDDFFYYNSDALEDFFDLDSGLLRGLGKPDLIKYQRTHAFTDYPPPKSKPKSHDEIAKEKEEDKERIESQKKRTEENKKLIAAALTGYEEVLVIKSNDYGIQILSKPSSRIKTIQDTIEQSEFD